MKRFISMLLCVCLVFGMLPMAAFAEEIEEAAAEPAPIAEPAELLEEEVYCKL